MLINPFKSFLRFFRARQGKHQPIVSHKKGQGTRAGQRRRRLELEVLEGRVVPAAPLVSSVLAGAGGFAVAGTVYEDLNADGVKNNGENGVSGWTVYLDLDQSGTLNQDAVGDWEPSAITNVDGDYAINHLKAGTYRFSEVLQTGWTPTSPVSRDVVVTKDTNKIDFFNFSGGDIVGAVWNDLNQDGVRATDPTTGEFTEPGLADWTVFLDLNKNSTADPTEPTTVTDANGRYSFVNLPPGVDYEVTEILPSGWEVTRTFDTHQTVTAIARREVTQDFANFSISNGSIQGTIWNDVNVDGIRDTDPVTGAFTEPGLEGWTVFLDTNNNRIADPGETTTLTDANGNYSFISLLAGDYEVTEVLPEGWDVTTTFDSRQTVRVVGGEASLASDFANFTVQNGSIRGTVWNDLNRDGSRATDLAGAFTEPGLAGWTVFLDRNENNVADVGEPIALTDSNGDYLFADLQVGDYEVRQTLPTRWEVTVGFGDSSGVTVFSGTQSVAPDFANFNLSTAVPGSVSGVVWNDLNGNGVRDVVPGTGTFTDPGLAGWTVFADLNANGVLDTLEPNTTSAADGSYTLSGILPGTVTIVEQASFGWRATAPSTGLRTISLRNGQDATGLDFGNWTLQDAAIRGVVFADTDKNGVRNSGERGLAGITVYLDLNNNGSLDSAEPQMVTSVDLFYTPAFDEAGSYSFTHLAAGTYTVRAILPEALSATPVGELVHTVTLVGAESHSGIDTAAVFRPAEIHGVKFDDVNGDHVRQAGELGVGGVTVFVDVDRDDIQDAGEPTAITEADGSYAFTGLAPGAYVVREVLRSGFEATYPTTIGGILWPQGVSNPAVGNVSSTSITTSLAVGATFRQTVSLTLPGTGALTNMVDVFLLFDDTGSFVNNSPIVRAAFPDIISQLQGSLPGIDLGFGVGRFEEYASFAYEYATGRPFILNQPIVAASTAGYMAAIQAALNRTTPGYGGDQPETDIEALYQLVTGLGFDGNNNGSVLDSGAAGLASTQLNPGNSGDVPSFASFQADAANNVMAAAGTIGGGGFRAGGLPIILVATDTGFAFQPRGETTITGVGGVTLPVSALTETSRPTTPFDSGAGFQQTITGLNALGGLVIGLGTNTEATLDPRMGLEALSKLTGAVNRSTATIANGTADAIAPGDPLYFQIASGFAGSVASGVVTAIQNAVTNVAVDITIQASDPRVKIVNHTGVLNGIGSGQTASFDIEFIGDGIPHRFDLQFVRNGTNVVLGSIPVVLGTPIPGNCYEFEDLAEGEIHTSVDFGSRLASTTSSSSTTTVFATGGVYNGSAFTATSTVTGDGGLNTTASSLHYFNTDTATDLFGNAPTNAGHYTVTATYDGDANHTASTSSPVAFTISQASSTTTVFATGGIYNGTAFPVTSTVIGDGGLNTTASSLHYFNTDTATDLFDIAPTNIGRYTVTATYDGDANHTASTSSPVAFTISQFSSTTIIFATGGTYNGSAFPATSTVIGDGGLSTTASNLHYFNTDTATDLFDIAPTNAGHYTVTATYDGDANHTASTSDAVAFTISQASSTMSVFATGGTYSGSAFPATSTVIGVGGLSTTASSLHYFNTDTATDLFDIAPTNAGHYTVTATYDGDANHTASTSDAVAFTISQASSTTSVFATGGTYSGSAFPATSTVIGVGGLSTTASSLHYFNTDTATDLFDIAPTNAGHYTVTATYDGDANHTASTSDAVAFTISQASSTTSVFATGGTYSGSAFAATSTVTGAGGLNTTASSLHYFNTDTATDLFDIAPTNAGHYTVTATYDGDANHTASTSGATAFTIMPAATTVPFAAFTAKVKIQKNELDLQANFTLGAGSNGVAPLAESMTLQIGTYSLLIPAGSFKFKKNGPFEFHGNINGMRLDVSIRSLGNGRYSLKVQGEGSAIKKAVSPITVGLTIGEDTGLITV